MSETTTHVISLTLDEALSLTDMAAASAGFRGPEQTGRFEVHDAPHLDINLVFSDPKFDNGSVLWVGDQRLSALVLAKVLRAEGFTAHVLWDMKPRGDGKPNGWVVLNSRPYDG